MLFWVLRSSIGCGVVQIRLWRSSVILWRRSVGGVAWLREGVTQLSLGCGGAPWGGGGRGALLNSSDEENVEAICTLLLFQ